MVKKQNLPRFVGKHKTHTLKRYTALIYKKIIASELFEAEYLFRYLDADNRALAIKFLNDKGLNYSEHCLLNISKVII